VRLILTHAYFLAEDAKERHIMKPYPPLGILYLSSHLRAKGFDVELYDSTFGSREQLWDLLENGPAGVLGLYANLMTRSTALAIMQRARSAGWRVVMGGPEPVNYADLYLEAGADIIVAGEGEFALECLLSMDFDRERWAEVPGILFQASDGSLVKTGPPRLLQDLDAQPWPDRERIDIRSYLNTWRDHHGGSSLSVITARGCPFRCNWCSHSVYGHTHRRRTPRAVVDEVEYLLAEYQPAMLWVADDVFTIHHQWIVDYAAELKRRGIRIPFECITRADRINDRIAGLMAEIGCRRIWIGSESGSQRILDAMQRGVTVEQVQRAVHICKEHSMETGMFLMWGYDGEDLSDVEATIDHVKACRPDVFLTTVSYPIKGTPYFDRVAERLVSVEPWASSSDRNLKVLGRHSRRFYQYADEVLRQEMAAVPDQPAIAVSRERLFEARSEVEA
jgi:anaerobic magnesium-protoporphyrin IX monomethyl ester cyclase